MIAPDISLETKNILSTKKNLILIQYNATNSKTLLHLKTTRNFLLLQNKDNKVINKKDLIIKTKIVPSDKEKKDMIFSFIISK